jgi:8-oxo-dGTP diphosphatase
MVPTGMMKTTEEKSAMFPEAPVPAVGAVVFKEDTVLLVKRGKPPSEGFWAIPGGSVQLGETLQQAAEREILEETGIEIEAKSSVYVFDAIERDHEGKVAFHYVIVDLEALYLRGEPSAADDAADARWVTEKEMSQLPVNPATRHLLFEKYRFGTYMNNEDARHG